MPLSLVVCVHNFDPDLAPIFTKLAKEFDGETRRVAPREIKFKFASNSQSDKFLAKLVEVRENFDYYVTAL